MIATKLIVIEDGYCGGWGKGETFAEAHKNAGRPRFYTTYRVHPSATVNGMGGINWNIGDAPDAEECDPVELPEQSKHRKVAKAAAK